MRHFGAFKTGNSSWISPNIANVKETYSNGITLFDINIHLLKSFPFNKDALPSGFNLTLK